MAGPWEEFQQPQQAAPAAGPWDDFRQPAPVQPAGPFDQHIEAAASKTGLPAALLRAQIQAESSGNPNARSPVGAMGLMQLMPGTAKELGVTNAFDPAQNIDAGARYMRRMLDQFGTLEKAAAAYNFGPGNVSKGRALPKETRDYVAKLKKAAPDLPWYGKVIKGAADPIAGALQLAAAVPDPAGDWLYEKLGIENPRKAVPRELKEEEQQYQKRRKEAGESGFDWTRLAGNVASPVSLATGAATRVPALGAGGLWRTAGQAALTGGAEGAIQPSYGEGDMVGQKAVQAGVGALMGPIFAGAGSVATDMIGKGAGLVAGKMKPAAGEVMDLAKKYGVNVTAGDIGGGKAASRAEAVLERIPVVGIDRLKQQAQAKAAGGGLARQLQDDMTSLSFQSLDKIQQTAAAGGRRADAANELLRQAASAGDDWKRIIQTSANLRAFRMQLGADELYGEVTRLAGDHAVPVQRTLDVLGDLDAQLGQAKLRDPESVRLVQQLMSTLDNPEMPNTYASIRQLDSDLGALIRSGRTGENAVIGDRAVGHLAEIRKTLRKDMDTFASQTPELKAAYNRAQNFYRSKVAPYKERDLARAMTDVDADTVYRAFIGRGEHGAGRFFDSLDEKGRSAVRYGMVKDAMARATDAANGEFRPVLFAKAMNDVQEAQGVYFKGKQAAELQGFTKLMDHLQRASKTQTGSDFASNAILPAGVASAVADPTGTAAMSSLGTFLAAKFLLTTTAGKRIIFSANLLKPGSTAMGKLAEEANRKLIEAGVEATTGGLAPRAADAINSQLPVVGGAIAGQQSGRRDQR